MKKLFFLAVTAIIASTAMAQSTKVMKIWDGGKVAVQKDIRATDSITFAVSDDRLAYVSDYMTLTGRGDVLTFDSLISGVFTVGDVVRIISPFDSIQAFTDTIIGIEAKHKTYNSTSEFPDTIHAGGFLFHSGIKEKIKRSARGAAIVAVENSPYEKAKTLICNAYKYTQDEGGRHTPFFVGYAPTLYLPFSTYLAQLFQVKVVDLGLVNGEAAELVMPGDSVENMVIESYQTVNNIGFGFVPYIGQTLFLKEGGYTIAKLTVVGWK